MAKTNPRARARHRRKAHIRKTVRGTTTVPRLSVFRTTNHIYAQVIDDTRGITLVAASTLSEELKDYEGHRGNRAAAKLVGELIGKKSLDAGIATVCFDRNGYLFHGRVKSLADAARGAGLNF